MDYKAILKNIKKKMRKSDVAESEFGDDWLAYVNHVYGNDVEAVPWELVEMHIDGLIDDEIKNLSVQDKCELWQVAISDDLYRESYLKELDVTADSDDFYKFYDVTKISEFLSSKLWVLADNDSHLLEEEEDHDEEDDDNDYKEDEDRVEAESDNYDEQHEDDENEDDEENVENFEAIY
jgi:hypothetical protein